MKKAKDVLTGDFIEVEGLVLPASWDDIGEPSEFKISSPGEQTYLIINNSNGRKLAQHLRQYIRVIGEVQVGINNEYSIDVRQIIQHE